MLDDVFTLPTGTQERLTLLLTSLKQSTSAKEADPIRALLSEKLEKPKKRLVPGAFLAATMGKSISLG